MREETKQALRECLDNLNPIDREVLALKHFEQLTTNEVAQVLQIGERAAAKRYLRALSRLRAILVQTKVVEL